MVFNVTERDQTGGISIAFPDRSEPNRRMLRRLASKLLGRHQHDVGATNRLIEAQSILVSQLLDQTHERPIHLSPGGHLDLSSLEYRVFSQFGDDGIIAYLTKHVPSNLTTFVEFGVQDYSESNTRLLLQKHNWRGLVIDASEEHIAGIRAGNEFWRHDLRAICAFISADNINQLIQSAGIQGKIGLLSVDIDGNDYWVWKAIECVDPLIVVCEYNSAFGDLHPVTIPYDANFARSEAHYSYLYAGASLGALISLAKQKGYRFIGSNSAGNNAYFLHNSFQPDIKEQSLESGYVESRFREVRSEEGELLFRTANESIDVIRHLPLVNVVTGEELTVGQARGMH